MLRLHHQHIPLEMKASMATTTQWTQVKYHQTLSQFHTKSQRIGVPSFIMNWTIALVKYSRRNHHQLLLMVSLILAIITTDFVSVYFQMSIAIQPLKTLEDTSLKVIINHISNQLTLNRCHPGDYWIKSVITFLQHRDIELLIKALLVRMIIDLNYYYFFVEPNNEYHQTFIIIKIINLFFYFQVFICITLEVKFTPNVCLNQQSLFNQEIQITAMDSIQQLFLKFHQDVHWEFSTIKNLPIYCLKRWPKDSKPFMSWQRCAQLECHLSKDGAPNITVKMSHQLHVGLKSIFMVLFHGLTKCSLKWAHLRTQFPQCHNCFLI